MTRILNQAQAEAVYSAMCALNNVGATVRVVFEREPIEVYELKKGLVQVCGPESIERHDNQAAFATAYGLQLG